MRFILRGNLPIGFFVRAMQAHWPRIRLQYNAIGMKLQEKA